MASKKNKKDKDIDGVKKKEVLAYKYSAKGTSSLYEAIIVQGEPHFITWSETKNKFTSKPQIEEATRIIRPPSAEEYPYTPYEFVDVAELNEYFAKANDTKSLGVLYQTAKSFFQKYVDQDKNIIVMLAADSIFTYFQDVFPATHYSEFVGGNDAGKSSIGFTFAYTAYRAVRGTSISGANYYRIIGNVEPGQCTIIEDEADNISEDPDKVKILKAGYELDSRVPKTNMNTRNQETNWYYPYCYKMVLAEKSLNALKAKGLVDRTFTNHCRPGKVNYSIKKVVSQTINKSPELERLYNELLDFRKLMLCYRLIHYSDDLPRITVSLFNRDEELSFPHLQLFYGTNAFDEIRTAMGFFLKQRRRRRGRSLEAALYPILKEMIAKRINFTADNPNLVNISYSDIWQKITVGTAEERPIKGNLLDDYRYETRDHNVIYQNTFSKFIADKFTAELKSGNKGSILTFDIIDFENYDSLYNHGIAENDPDVVIEVTEGDEELEPSTSQSSEGSEGNEGSSNAYDENNFHSFENGEKENTENAPPEPSQPSQPSQFPPNCYWCDYSGYGTKDEYYHHCVTRHPRKPGYPGPADIKEGLTPQGMPWET